MIEFNDKYIQKTGRGKREVSGDVEITFNDPKIFEELKSGEDKFNNWANGIAQTRLPIHEHIKNLLGGDAFVSATGASMFGSNGYDLTFRLPEGVCNFKINLVIIMQMVEGYRVKFYYNPRGNKSANIISEFENIPGGKLGRLFERETGIKIF